MKYLTKEWLIKCRQIELLSSIKYLKTKEDKSFEALYNNRLKKFLKEERTSPIYKKTSQIKRDDKFLNKVFAEKILCRKKLLITLGDKFNLTMNEIELLSVGYCFESKKEVIEDYLVKVIKEIEKIAVEARAQEKAVISNYCSHKDFDMLAGAIVKNINITGKEAFIETEDAKLVIKNPIVILREEKEYFQFDYYDQYSKFTLLQSMEIQKVSEKDSFQISILLDNYDEYEKSKLWYLIIECDDFEIE